MIIEFPFLKVIRLEYFDTYVVIFEHVLPYIF